MSYQPEDGTKDLTQRLSGSQGQREESRDNEHQLKEMRDKMQQKDIKIKFMIEEVESRHGHRRSPGGGEAEIGDKMELEINWWSS